ncbi:hypothetical protein [uncultured Pseudokineococcus sp.]|uniref:hypothetical protein n=1 Tax=uncultured Pseudokineococcus sp. TaxID=1642928 RepID=UPI0026082D57|nr:hypothetical protein [uncultured Pseudokineococcus sp.]
MDAPDQTMSGLGEAIEMVGRGERLAARELLLELWEGVGPTGDPLHRCALAHHLADVQDDLVEELAWDERALLAADSITAERAAEAGVAGSVAGLYPSLHLNLGDDHRRLGDLDAARRHLALGQDAAGALGEDGYSAMIRRGLERLAARLTDE